LQQGIEELSLEVLSSGLERIPVDTKPVADEHIPNLEKLFDKLEEDEDVQNFFHNMAEKA
jgi:transcriptional/translational regulatory protein YebC/TACO1